MITMSASVCIDAPAERVWELLARLEDIVLWSDSVLAAECPTGRARGVGAKRVCVFRGGVTLTEHWTAWDEGRGFSYEGSGLPMVRTARNTWTVEAIGDMTLLRTHAEVILRGSLLGWALQPLVQLQARRMGARSLGAFKHLVERQRPTAASGRRSAS